MKNSSVQNGQMPAPGPGHEILRFENHLERARYIEILNLNKPVQVYDTISSQLREYIKLRHPARRLSDSELDEKVTEHLNGIKKEDYGVWVWYPWSQRLVHLLDEKEFVFVRTNRNLYKITEAEKDLLASKTIGIIGLSVGQSIAVTLAMERVCGKLRLADFDELELSNLNRIRASVHELGLSKVQIAAREIAELDPFIEVSCYENGVTEATIEGFMQGLDLVFDECDSLDIKIIARDKARKLGIPLVMETSDRGMLDVERYDLEPGRPLLHGLLGDVDPASLSSLSNEDKIPIVLRMAGVHDISVRGRASMIEVGQSISTWPQLASSVVLGGAVSTDVARRILTGEFNDSGRYYVDLEDIISSGKADSSIKRNNPFKPLNLQEMTDLIGRAGLVPSARKLSGSELKAIVSAGIAAPSTGNDQPWKWVYSQGTLYLFHDRHRSFSFGDFRHIASYLTLGAVTENVKLEAQRIGLQCHFEYFPLQDEPQLAVRFHFEEKPGNIADPLAGYIYQRSTNRNLSERKEIPAEVLAELEQSIDGIHGAELQWVTEPEKIEKLAEIIAACDRIRLLNPEGHYDFVNHEMRWTPEDADTRRDGIDTRTLGLNSSQMSALEVLKDHKVIDMLNDLGGGKVLEAATMRSVKLSSALAFLTIRGSGPIAYLEGGRALERLWLRAEMAGLAVHPVISPLYLFPRLLEGKGEGLSAKNILELKDLRYRFERMFTIHAGASEVFLCKFAFAEKPVLKTLRIPVEEVLTSV